MDDLKFRRRIMSDPKARDEELIDVINRDENSAKFADDILNLDDQIAKAMKVDVPDDLADRILFSQTSREESETKPSAGKRSFALAASVAFAFGLLVGQLNWGNLVVPPAQASLANTALQHVADESPFTDLLDEQVTSAQINTKLQPFAYQFNQDFPYHVYYLNHCGFGQSNALHMVFQGEVGKITLFITNIPSSENQEFSQEHLSGVVSQLGNSSLILVGESGENVVKIAQRLIPMIATNH